MALDLGCGDGRYPYRLAARRPDTLSIGIDANATQLAEYSAKAVKKPSRGGLPNVLYVLANAEDLPAELTATADCLTINLPWGSLLSGLVQAEPCLLHSIARAAKPGANLEMVINLAAFISDVPRELQSLPVPTVDYICQQLKPRYHECGINIRRAEEIGKDGLRQVGTDWAQRLAYGRQPQAVRISATIARCATLPARG